MNQETLRRAAALMRERAQAATPGPWGFEAAPNGFPTMVTGHDMVVADTYDKPDLTDAAHIASWHPAVALAVADLIENAECLLRCDADGMREPYCSACSDSTYDHDCPDREVCPHSVQYRKALTVARAYLGEQSA